MKMVYKLKNISLALVLALTIFYAKPSEAALYLKPHLEGAYLMDYGAKGMGLFGGLGFGFREEYIHLLADVRYGFFNMKYPSVNGIDVSSLLPKNLGALGWSAGIGFEWNIPIQLNFMITSLDPNGGDALVGGRVEIHYFMMSSLTAFLAYESISKSATTTTPAADASAVYLGIAKTFEFFYPTNSWRADEISK